MAAYTKKQIELVKQIRKLDKREFACNLPYEEKLKLMELIKQANSENLCWW